MCALCGNKSQHRVYRHLCHTDIIHRTPQPLKNHRSLLFLSTNNAMFASLIVMSVHFLTCIYHSIPRADVFLAHLPHHQYWYLVIVIDTVHRHVRIIVEIIWESSETKSSSTRGTQQQRSGAQKRRNWCITTHHGEAYVRDMTKGCDWLLSERILIYELSKSHVSI